MKHLAAYLLLVLGGNKNPSAKDVQDLMKTVGIEAEMGQLNLLIDSLKGKKLEDIINGGLQKITSMPSACLIN